MKVAIKNQNLNIAKVLCECQGSYSNFSEPLQDSRTRWILNSVHGENYDTKGCIMSTFRSSSVVYVNLENICKNCSGARKVSIYCGVCAYTGG